MELNGIGSVYNRVSAAYSANTNLEKIASKPDNSAPAEQPGAIYEPSKEGLEKAKASVSELKAQEQESETEDSEKTDKEEETSSIKDLLKANEETRKQKIQEMVEEMLLQQSTLSTNLIKLYKGTLEPGTIEAAKKEVVEDGYWGAEKTSDRMLEFAVALAGDDIEKLKEMKEAFEKGYEQAEKAWGGELPELCQKTRDLTLEKFDKLINDSDSESSTEQ